MAFVKNNSQLVKDRASPTATRQVTSLGFMERVPYSGDSRTHRAILSNTLGERPAAQFRTPETKCELPCYIYSFEYLFIPAVVNLARRPNACTREIVEKGFNLQVWRSADNVPLVHALDRAHANWPLPKTIPNLRIVTPSRAYIDIINGAGRAPEAARNLR
jgi:hypothetical protein